MNSMLRVLSAGCALPLVVACVSIVPDEQPDEEASAQASGTGGSDDLAPAIEPSPDAPPAEHEWDCASALVASSFPWRFVHFLDPLGTRLREADQTFGWSCAQGSGGPCDTPWSSEQPWQWAAAQKTFECSGFGSQVMPTLLFEARSRGGPAHLQVQLSTRDERPLRGEIYKSPELELDGEWRRYRVEFSDVVQPAWSTVTVPLDIEALTGVSLLVREVEEQVSGAGVVGEKLLPFGIEIRGFDLDRLTI